MQRLNVNSWSGKLWKFSASAFLMILKINTKNNWKYVIIDMFNKPIAIIGNICK